MKTGGFMQVIRGYPWGWCI